MSETVRELEGIAAGAGRVRRAVLPRTVLAVASLGVFMTFVDATIVNIAFPAIERSFPGTSLSGLSWVLNAYNIVFAAFLVGAGRVADLIGRRRAFKLGIAGFTFASVLCAAAPSVGLLIAARVLQAAAAALLVPASLGLVLESFAPGRRAHAVALWGASAAVAVGLGPSLGGVLVDATSWRMAFLVNLPIGVGAYVLAGRMLVESRAPGRRTPPDLLGTLLLAAGIGALTLGIVKGEDWGWGAAGQLAAFAAAAVLTVAFVRRSRVHATPVLEPALFRIRHFSFANALTVVGAMGFFANLLCGVLFLTGVWRYSLLSAGLALTPAPFVGAAVAGLWGRLADRFGFRAVVVPGTLIYAGGIAWYLTQVTVRPDFVAGWLPGQVLSGLGAAAMLPMLNSAAVAAAPGERYATAAAINAAARQLGGVLGIALLVAIVGTPDLLDPLAAFHHGWTFVLVCLLLVVAGGAGLAGRPALPREEEATDKPAARAAALPRIPVGPRPSPAPPRPSMMLPALAGLRPDPAAVLAACPPFADLAPGARSELAEGARLRHLRAGEWLFRQGDVPEGMFVIATGRLELQREDGSLRRPLGAGAALGELGILHDTPRSASVRARRDSEVLELPRQLVVELSRRHASLALALARISADHLRQHGNVDAGPPQTVAVVSAPGDAEAGAVADRLVHECGAHGTVTELTAPAGLDTAAAVAGLDVSEQTYDRVLLRAGAGSDPAWRDFCVRQADRVVVVADTGGPLPDDARLRGCHLVLRGDGPLSRWYEALAPRSVHRTGIDDAVPAVARRLCGRATGLVLSGGGARALAHVGVLEELVAAGVEIDRVGGVSMGALIGAMFAAGMTPEEIDAHLYDDWVRRNPLRDYTIPRRGLIRGDDVKALLRRTFGSLRIEELARGFFCVTCDLLTGELVVHREGPLVPALSATLCIPGLAPPQELDGRLLVDGGVLNNLPVDVMAADGEGPVIASDVTNETTRGWRDGRLPTLPETLTRVAVLASADTAALAREHADLLIAPKHDGVGLLEFHQLDRLRGAGRRAARAVLAGDAVAAV